jgi:predicted RNA-binding Zn-ribbon protein involved in translation (DUF1610 family)
VKFICPTCGGEGVLQPFVYPYFVKGLIRRRYFAMCSCPNCFRRTVVRSSFDAEMTRSQFKQLLVEIEARSRTPIGRVDD